MKGTPRPPAAPRAPAAPTRRQTRQNGAAIRALREKDGFPQTQLAQLAGIDQSDLSRIENEQTNARATTLNRIARALRVPAAAIMRDPETGEVLDLTPEPPARLVS